MSLIPDICKRAAAFVTDRATLEEFEEWFVQESWDVQQTADADAIRLVYDIERSLSELTSGYMTEDDFRHFLIRRVLESHWAIPHTSVVRSATRTTTVAPSEADTRYEVVRG